MAENNPNSNTGGQNGAAGVAAGIGPVIAGIFNNLWSAKERRRSEEYNSKQLGIEQNFAREQANTQWQRANDYKYQMQQYKDAGINPYMVASKGVQPTMGASPSGNLPQQARFNFDSIGQIGQNLAQLALINSQTKNNEADANLKNITADQTAFNLSIDNKYKDKVSVATLENLKQTNSNLQETNQLLQGQQTGQQLSNAIQQVNAKFAEKQAQLDMEGKDLRNSQTKVQTRYIEQSISNLKTASDQIKSVIALNKQALQTGQLTQAQLAVSILKIMAENGLIDEKTITEKQSRQPNINNTKRSNWNFMSLPEGFSQKLEDAISR